MSRPRRRALGAISIAMAGALSLGACGVGATNGGGATSEAQLSAAAANVESYGQVPEWTAPGPALDVSQLRGKRIFVIPITSGSAFEVQVEEAEKEIASKLGIDITFYTNQGTVAEWVQGMNAAIAAKPDLIFLESAPDPRQLQPQLKAAGEAGIPVVASHIWDKGDPNPPACTGCEGLDAIVRGPFADSGRMMADAVINDSKGKANVLMVGIQGINSGDIVNKAQSEEYEQNCPGCRVKEITLTLDQISGGALQAVTSALTSDPTIDYIVPTFDILVTGVVASMNTANRSEGTKVVSFGGTSDVMALLADPKSPVIADVAEPIRWSAYANLDQAFRLMLGMAPALETTPARLFDKSNVSEAGAPAYTGGFGDAYVDGYLELWSVNG